MKQRSGQEPTVSVLMPVYNASRYLPFALNSVLGQTFTDFELIAIDDGSTDGSEKILDAYQKKDSRIVVVHQNNSGLVASLNTAIKLSRGKYLARQDGDDISFPERFEEEVAVLEKNPEIVLVTGSFEVFDENDEFLHRNVLPADNEDIKRAMYLRNPIGHGSVMFRKSACLKVGLYDDSYGPTEDYELWSRLSGVGKFAVLENALFHWRVSTSSITSKNLGLQTLMMDQHIERLWASGPPRVISAEKMRAKAEHYCSTYPKRGAAMKNILLADNAQIAVKLVRRGHLFLGLQQLTAVCLTGRAGIGAVFYRLRVIWRETMGMMKRKLHIGRMGASS